MAWTSVASFFAIIVAVIIGNVLCGDATNIRQSNNNAWPQLDNNKNLPSNTQGNANSKSTTPWPALGERKNQPMWVRPNNGTNWVRNSPNPNNQGSPSPVNSPIRNSNSQNYNTNFLNGERGVVGVRPQTPPISNQRAPGGTNMNYGMSLAAPPKPVGGVNQNQGANNRNSNAGLSSVVGGGGNKNPNNNNNGMRDAPTGPTNPEGPTLDQNEGSNKQSTGGEAQDYELREFSEELLTKDSNNVARLVTINLQGMTTSRSTNDEAPLPLLSIDRTAYSTPSIEKLMQLYNNYIVESNQNEVYTAQEKIEENNLLDTIVSTPVMQHTRNFLIQKGKIGKDPKEFKDMLRLIWFGMYSRGGGRIGSSGFEHVFLAELKNNQVSGLHNWLYFSEEEANQRANYLGYMRKIDLGNKGAILKYHFTFRGVDKPVGSMFIGTSPELEIALYSTCFILRADRICPLKMGGNRFIIRTYTYRYRGKNMIGSAFPEI